MVYFLNKKKSFCCKHKKLVIWYFKILMLILGNFPRFYVLMLINTGDLGACLCQ